MRQRDLQLFDYVGFFAPLDRVFVMKNGKMVGSVNTADVTKDDVLGMIILGKMPGRQADQELEALH